MSSVTTAPTVDEGIEWVTVGDLLKLIAEQKISKDSVIMMSSDAEGNSYQPMWKADVCDGLSVDESTGSMGIQTLTAGHAEGGWGKEDVVGKDKTVKPMLLLLPSHYHTPRFEWANVKAMG